jgi:hypothetical protein
MTQTINNIADVGKIIAKQAAGMLGEKAQFVSTIDKEPSSSFDQVNGYNVGNSISINKPARFIPGSSADITSAIQEVVEEKTSLTLDIRKVIPVALTSAEIQNTLRLKDWTKRILEPAMSSIAQHIDQASLTLAKNYAEHIVGTPGSTVYDTDLMLSAREKLYKNGKAPMDDDLIALLDSTAMRSAVNARKGYFSKQAELDKQYTRGYMGAGDGFKYYESNLLPRHTNGADVVFAVENSVVTIANGMTTLGVDGVTSGATIKAGTKFTIASCYDVDPITKVALPNLKIFTVTADVTETASNQVTLAISPAIYYTTTDPRQNVSTAPVDEDACVVLSGSASTAYNTNLAYHKSAFRFASVPLMKPSGAHMAEQETVDGFTVRVWMDANILTDKMILRLDFLGGFAAVRPEWACVLTS